MVNGQLMEHPSSDTPLSSKVLIHGGLRRDLIDCIDNIYSSKKARRSRDTVDCFDAVVIAPILVSFVHFSESR